MKEQLNNPNLIQKEIIPFLNLNHEEVLENQSEIESRKLKLGKALILGNINKHKVKIYFKDEFKLNLVETTVWGVTDKRVILKSGTIIPINRIIYVKLL